MPAGERFTVTTFTSATSLIISQNDSLPPRIPLGGLSIAINANSNWMATFAVDNGVGPVDISSLLTGSASIGGGAGQRLYRLPTFTPWKVWMNVNTCQGNVQVAAGI